MESIDINSALEPEKDEGENALVRQIVDILRPMLIQEPYPNLAQFVGVAAHIKIVSEFTVIPEKGTFELVLGSAEQDIVFFLKEPPIDFPGIRLARRSDASRKIPLSIFEAKIGDPITHAIAQYARMADKIRSVFPFVRYNFLNIGTEKERVTSAEKLWRQTKTFHEVLQINGTPEEIAARVFRTALSDLLALQRQHIVLDEAFARSA